MSKSNPASNSVFKLEDVPVRDAHAQLVFGNEGEVLIVKSGQAWRFNGSTRQVLRHLLPLVDGKRTVQEICKALGHEDKPELVIQVLDQLHGNILSAQKTVERRNPLVLREPVSQRTRAAVIGNGPLAAAIAEGLAVIDGVDCVLFQVGSFASCLDLNFQLDTLINVPAQGEGEHVALQQATRVIEAATLDDLRTIFDSHDVVVSALESTWYRAILDVNTTALASGRPWIPVTIDGGDVVIGPLVIGGKTPCFACSLQSTLLRDDPDRAKTAVLLPMLRTGQLTDPTLLHDVVRTIRDEVRRITSDPPSGLAFAMLRVAPKGEYRLSPIRFWEDCAFCAAANGSRDSHVLERRATVSLSLTADSRTDSTVRGRTASSDAPYRSIGILGGGTAGYMAAIALRTRRPELNVTLIESSSIPIIGVGEATTPRVLEFLHARSGLDIVDLCRRVRPSWKLGIRFFWGLPGDYSFSGAFQFASLLEPMVYNGNIDCYSLGCTLMAHDKVPVFENGDGSYTSYLHRVPFAYHLDNRRFVRYLQEEAARLGVRHLDRVIKDAELTADGEEIACLVDENGERHQFDLYIDASGFRSFLLEHKLGSKFVSFGSSLFTDSAIMAQVPNNGVMRPYTAAITMDNGWCWSIPFHDADHRGYVFSSAFCSVDQAVDEMVRKNPGIAKPWSLQFKSGRHEHFWRGNVVALGNSYGFVEPLESTGLEMLTIEIDLLIDHLPASRHDRSVKQSLNRRLNAMWDDLRGLLAVHYKFNRKLDTPFWRACRQTTDLGTAGERVSLFSERGPLTEGNTLLPSDSTAGFFSQNYIYDVLLCGMQVPARYFQPLESRQELYRRQSYYRECAHWAISQPDAWNTLYEQPETLRSIFTHPESWSRSARF